jgi:hypothetical protein
MMCALNNSFSFYGEAQSPHSHTHRDKALNELPVGTPKILTHHHCPVKLGQFLLSARGGEESVLHILELVSIPAMLGLC